MRRLIITTLIPSAAAILIGGGTGVTASGQAPPNDPGAQTFASRCASCHGTDANGGEHDGGDRRD